MEPKELPKRIEITYKDALDQILFLKKQQWVIAGYGVGVQAALLAITNQIKPNTCGRLALIAIAGLAALYGIGVLRGFHNGLDKFRERLDWIYDNHFERSERDGLSLGKARSLATERVFVWGLYATLFFSAALGSMAIWHSPGG